MVCLLLQLRSLLIAADTWSAYLQIPQQSDLFVSLHEEILYWLLLSESRLILSIAAKASASLTLLLPHSSKLCTWSTRFIMTALSTTAW